MSGELLEIQPQEIKFIFELEKQLTCPVQLVNKSEYHVAFKVKTTSPKKYCVQPNTGIVKPNSSADFIIKMEAQKLAPPDMICLDKFLVQRRVVPAGTAAKDITCCMFGKYDGSCVYESKLRVIVVSPLNSPVQLPINRTFKQVPAYKAAILMDQVPGEVESLNQHRTVDENAEPKMKNSEEVLLPKDVEYKTINVVQEPAKDVEHKSMKDVEELKVVNDIELMKTKLNEFELKLSEAAITVTKLAEERGFSVLQLEIIQLELALLRRERHVKKAEVVELPLLWACMVALIGVMIGHFIHRWRGTASGFEAT
ncbi:hypothetical protein NMG60_11029958 [Bertholletia excelsa]